MPGGELWCAKGQLRVGNLVRLRTLSKDISLSLKPHGDSTIMNSLPCIIDDIGSDSDCGQMLIRVLVDKTAFVAKVTAHSLERLNLHVGMRVWMQIKSVAVIA